MILELRTENSSKIIDVPETENDCFKAIGEFIFHLKGASTVHVSCSRGDAVYSITPRSGTMFVREQSNSINLPSIGNYPSVYLTCVNQEHNNYKFYQLDQNGNDVVATYGRIGSQPGEMFGVRNYTYPRNMFWIKYYEKIAKGYVDRSDIMVMNNTTDVSNPSPKASSNDPISKLYDYLLSCSKQIVQSVLTSGWQSVSTKQYKECKKILKKMYERKTVSGFNKQLLELIAFSPRKVHHVDDLLAKKVSDFASILTREEDLLSAMQIVADSNEQTENSFASMDIEVYIATDKQKEQVMNKLSSTLQNKVKTVYRVINHKTQKRFDAYLKSNNIKKVKQFWHGSRNENWLSIMKNGLSLSPNAKITGKMFGNGIYFAPKSDKSWNYTSYKGSYWAKGSSDVAFMALYATAYGNPLDVTCAHHYTKQTLQDHDCVHAHAGSQLLNDEIIFYDEDAITINYVVEFK